MLHQSHQQPGYASSSPHHGTVLIITSIAFLAVWATAATRADEPLIDPDEALPHIRWTDTERFVGQVAFVSGQIKAVGHAPRIHFLNFDARRRDVFNLVIFDEHIDKFPDQLESLYEGQIIEVRGVVSRYRDHAQIRVSSPQQIKVLTELPPTRWREDVQLELGDHLKVATFNVLNLFDDEDDPYRDDDSTSAKSRDQLRLVAKLIHRVDADVLALQEVESRGYLQRFTDVFLHDLGYYHVVHYEGNDGRGIDVCLMSRVPVGPVTSYRHLQFPDAAGKMRHFRRDLLSVRLEPPGTKPFEVWVVHLKSKAGGREESETIRLAEAKKIRELLDARLAQDPPGSDSALRGLQRYF